MTLLFNWFYRSVTEPLVWWLQLCTSSHTDWQLSQCRVNYSDGGEGGEGGGVVLLLSGISGSSLVHLHVNGSWCCF